MQERFSIGAEDRFSLCSGIAHDPLQRDIFTPLFFGASVHIPTEEDIITPGQLGLWMLTHDISISCLTPAMGQLLTSQMDSLQNASPPVQSLRAVFFVGDCLIKRDVNRLRQLAPNAIIINMYGSTETQRAVGYWQVPSDAEERDNLTRTRADSF
jgi:L-aminoadipate-semialdehyde dehydrogenase